MVSTSSEQHRAYLVACMPYTKDLASGAGDAELIPHVGATELLAKKLDTLPKNIALRLQGQG